MKKKGTIKLKKSVKIGIVVTLGIFIVGLSIFLILNKPIVEFKEKSVELEIHSEYKADDFIEKINGYELKDITIDTSLVNVDKIGKYGIKYKIKDKEYIVELKIVDKTPPTYEVISLEKATGVDINPEEFVKDIKDQTKTKVFFKEEYDFRKEGQIDIVIVVEDESKNKTEKTTKLTLKKDTEKPVLEGLKDYSVTPGSKIDYLSGITAKDNLDANPKLEVDSSAVQLSKLGSYNVKYTVTDQSGNKNTYTKKVNIVEKREVTKIPENSNKVVYLTFDDGPSPITKQIIDILDKYNAKATFFVTGNSQKYNHYIKEAHDKGHTIGLHTYTHDYKRVYASVDAYFDDLNKIGNMVKGVIGYFPHYIRFPGGASNTISRHYSKGIMTTLTAEVQRRGFQYYDWNAGTGDASGNNVPVASIIRQGTSSKSNNIMMLAHDISSKKTTVEALPKIIEHYQSLGYQFKGIDDSTFTPHQRVNN